MTATTHRLAILLVLGILAANGCSDRGRSNPLDPLNPNTKGAPTNFSAVADGRTATLTWDGFAVDGMTRYRIYRGVQNEPPAWYDSVAAQTKSYTDTNLAYDTLHVYAVQAVTTTSVSEISPPDSVIPGPVNFLVADELQGVVFRLSYDGKHLLGTTYLYTPRAVVYAPIRDLIWVAAYYDRAILAFDTHFDQQQKVALTGRPLLLARDPFSDDIYTLLRQFDGRKPPYEILRIDRYGSTFDSFRLPDSLAEAYSLVYNPYSRWLWLSGASVSGEGQIFRLRVALAGAGWITFDRDLDHPHKLLPDRQTGGCWAATDSGVVRMDRSGNIARYETDLRILDISVNHSTGDCYYVGAPDGQPDQSAVGRIVFSDSTVVSILPRGAVGHLTLIQTAPGAGPVGFLAYQSSRDRLLRFDSEGQLIGLFKGLSGSLEFALE